MSGWNEWIKKLASKPPVLEKVKNIWHSDLVKRNQTQSGSSYCLGSSPVQTRINLFIFLIMSHSFPPIKWQCFRYSTAVTVNLEKKTQPGDQTRHHHTFSTCGLLQTSPDLNLALQVTQEKTEVWSRHLMKTCKTTRDNPTSVTVYSWIHLIRFLYYFIIIS